MIQKILLATTLTEDEESDAKVLRYAQTLAKAMGASVVVMVAYQPPPPLRRRVLGGVEEMRLSLEAEGREIVADLVGPLQAEGIATAALVVEGNLAEAILRAAEEEKPDLIVVGSAGAGLPGLLLGGVADVVRHAPVPVLVVK